MYQCVLDLNTTEEYFGTVRRHLDSALFGTQKRTTRVVRFVFETNSKKNQWRVQKCQSAELGMTCTIGTVNCKW